MKQRYYRITYWNNACIKIEEELPFDNYDAVYRFLYGNNFNVLTVTYIGWK